MIRLQWLGGSLLGACWAGSPRSRCDCSLWHVEYRDQGSSSRPYTKTNNAMKRVSVNGQGSVAGLVATSDTNPAWVALCHGAHNSESNENGSIRSVNASCRGKTVWVLERALSRRPFSSRGAQVGHHELMSVQPSNSAAICNLMAPYGIARWSLGAC